MPAIATNDGGLIFVGSTGEIKDYYAVGVLPWVVKLNQHGKIVWQKVYDSGKSGAARASAITATSDGGYVVGSTSGEGWVLRIKADGSLSWQTAFHHDGRAVIMGVSAVRQEKDGHILVMGTVSEGEPFAYYHVTGNIWTARLDSEGKMLWNQGFGKNTVPDFYYVSAIHDTPNDGTVFVGTKFTGWEVDGLIVQTRPNGLTCSGFQEPMEVSSYEISLTARPVKLGTKNNDLVMHNSKLTQAPASVKIVNLAPSSSNPLEERGISP